MFNNITVKRINRDTNVEIERFKVPIVYAPKEKYYARLRSDPELNRPVQVILPRMSFELVGFNYDPARKQNSMLRQAKANTETRVASNYMGVPYDLNFDLQIYARNVDDGTHIVEQILPYFTPDYTLTVDMIPELGFLKDVPIILNSVTNEIEHEGNFDAVRYVSWTLSFTMKGYYYGPITQPKIIRKVIANINNDPSLRSGYITRVNVGQGNNGDYKIDDIVYQGDSYDFAKAYGVVTAWNANTAKLTLAGVQGQFNIDQTIKAVSSNASYTLESFEVSPLKLATVTVEPDPLTAQPDDDYGYSIDIKEWPDT
jgi:hypothetical protein